MVRAFLSALAGAAIVFITAALLHMATPLGSLGLSELPPSALQAMRSSIPNSGLYLFSDPEQGPYGFMSYTTGAVPMMTPKQLVMEFLANFAAALIATVVLILIPGPLLRRAGVVTLMALFAWLTITVSHLVWYKFPLQFILGALLVEVIAWFLAGLAMAKIVR